MKKIYYRKIIGSNPTPAFETYLRQLQREYKSKPITLKLKNNFKKHFIIFPDALKPLLKEYEETFQKCMKFHNPDKAAY